MNLNNFKLTLFFAFALFFQSNLRSQVKINEYSGANIAAVADASGNYPDWIELYNPGTQQINIAGFYLSNDPGNISKWQFPLNTLIKPKGFLKVFASGANTLLTNGAGVIEYHTNFKFIQTYPEKIILSNQLGVISDSLTIVPNLRNQSRGRSPDGANTWKVFPTPTFNASNTGNAFIDYLKKPLFSVAPGTYSGAINLTLSSSQSNAIIKYTLDGSDPNTSPTALPAIPTPGSITININSTKVVRAICIEASTTPTYLNSFIETNTYFFSPDNNFTFPVVSVCLDTIQLFVTATTVDATCEYFDANRSFAFETFGSASKHANSAWINPQKGFDYAAVDEYGYNYTNNYQFFDNPTLGYSSRNKFEKLIFNAASADNFPSGGSASGGNKRPCHLRDAFSQSYALRKNFNLDGRRYEPVIVFINGKYWGIYEVRENFDKEYTDYYYSQPNMMELNYSGGAYTNSPPNSVTADWTNAYNYVMNNSMTNASNYNTACDKIDMKSLIDFMVYNTYIANSSIISWNTAWWRGTDGNKPNHKWRYWMLDMDNTWGAGENYTGINTTGPLSNPCSYNVLFPPSTPAQTGHPALVTKLMTNTTFRSQYINRYADLLNTSLSCDSIMEHYNYFKSFLTPEMPRHIKRWASTTTTAPNDSIKDWNRNMDSLKTWITKRCKYIDSLLVDCYKVKGPYQLCMDIEQVGAGTIKLNSINVSNFPFYGTYFGGVIMTAKAIPNQNYIFDHWETVNFQLPDDQVKKDSITWNYDTTSCIKAIFKLKEPFNTDGEALVPTGFSPNGDGQNDILNIYGTLRATHFEFEVFNRWGQMVFQSKDKTKGWDGKFGGTEAPVGVYAYRINVIIDGTEIVKHGNFTLIR